MKGSSGSLQRCDRAILLLPAGSGILHDCTVSDDWHDGDAGRLWHAHEARAGAQDHFIASPRVPVGPLGSWSKP